MAPASGELIIVDRQGGVRRSIGMKTAWSLSPPAHPEPRLAESVGLLVHEGRLLAADHGLLRVIDVAAGTVEGSFAFRSGDLDEMVIVGDLRIAPEFHEADGRFYCCARTVDTGEQRWLFKDFVARGCVTATDAFGDGLWMVVHESKELLRSAIAALDRATGELRWLYSVAEPYRYELDDSVAGSVLGGVVSYWNGALYFAAGMQHLVAIDAETAAPQWTTATGASWPNATLTSDGKLHYISYSKHGCVDALTGDILFERDIEQRVLAHVDGIPLFGRLMITKEVAYVCDNRHGVVLGLSLETSDVVWSFQCEGGVHARHPPIVAGGKLHVLDDKGNLYMFEEDR